MYKMFIFRDTNAIYLNDGREVKILEKFEIGTGVDKSGKIGFGCCGVSCFTSLDGSLLFICCGKFIKVISILDGEVLLSLVLEFKICTVKKVIFIENNTKVIFLTEGSSRCMIYCSSLETKQIIYSVMFNIPEILHHEVNLLEINIGNNLVVIYNKLGITFLNIETGEIVSGLMHDFYFGITERIEILGRIDKKRDLNIISIYFNSQLNEFVMLANCYTNKNYFKILNLNLDLISEIQGYNVFDKIEKYLFYDDGNKVIFFNERKFFKVFDVLTGECIHVIKLNEKMEEVFLYDDSNLYIRLKSNINIYNLVDFTVIKFPTMDLREVIPLPDIYRNEGYILK